jgi:Opioid growth factor receptor (OGFr) conserved region
MSIIRSNSWEERSRNWLRPGNHNHLRLTRILKSLSILGLKDYAHALFEALNAVFSEESGAITVTTMRYWKRAMFES